MLAFACHHAQARPAHFPDAVVPGYDQVVWTHWTGRYQNLKGQFLLSVLYKRFAVLHCVILYYCYVYSQYQLAS